MLRERQLTDEQGERFRRAYWTLERLGAADVKHSGRTLLGHLLGTWRLLNREAEPEPVCLAGLYHSVYGTKFFTSALLDGDAAGSRARVCAVIGEEAEHLVHLFCSLDRPRVLVLGGFAGPERADLLTIELANLLEQGGARYAARTLLAVLP